MKEVKIIIGRHAFVVVPLTKTVQDIIFKFNKQFQTYRKERIKKRVVVVRDKLYLVHNPIFKEYYYPITKLRDFAFELYNHGIGKDKCEIIYKDKPKRYKVDFKWKFKHQLRDYQKKYVKTITKSLIKNHTFLIDLQTGKGKFLTNETLIKLPNTNNKKWECIGNLKVGDYVVGDDGKPTKVIGVYPQGKQKIYKITFQDGRTIEAGGEHLWKVFNRKWDKQSNFKILNTLDIIKLLDNNESISIPLIHPEEDGYELGRDTIINLAVYLLEENYYEIKRNEHLYLYSSYITKVEILKSLFSIINLNISEAETISLFINKKEMAEFMVNFIRSIGGISYYEEKERTNNELEIINRYYSVNIFLTLKNTQSLYIKSIKYIGEKEATCIAVDNESKLYVAENYIVTHNTTIASKTVDSLSYRTAILVLPKYINKWVGDIKEHFKLKDSDIFVVQGSDSLIELMNMNKESLPKFIIFSNRTMYFYIKAYEELQFKDMFQFPYLPYKLFDKLKISVLVVDETHQEFHSVYKFALIIDPTLLIGLSATLEHKDKRIMNLYELLYPKETRLSFLEYDKYIHVTAIRYLLPISKNFKYMQGGYGYSQTKFEESILRFRNILTKFERMILHYLKIKYISRKKHREKCLLFFGSVDMCTYMTKVIAEAYPKLKVSRYVSNDSYDEMMKSDIIISTPGSSGTALDIPKLLTVLSTIATDSVQLNLQMLGRLRKQPNRDVEFIYFYCGNIDQHNKYHYNRIRLFTDKAASIKQTMYK